MMERLTTGFECYFVPKELIEVDECNMTIECKDCWEMCEKANNNCKECAIQTAFNKLAAYEDAAEQGLLIQKTDADITQIIKGKLLVLNKFMNVIISFFKVINSLDAESFAVGAV